MARYAVIDANGVVVNHILIDDPFPAGYYPGYGAALVPCEPVTVNDPGKLDIHVLKITEIPGIGDTLNLNTGEITKFVPEIVQDFDHEKGEPRVDEKGDPVMVATAPKVEFKQDVDPATVKQVIDKPQVETKGK